MNLAMKSDISPMARIAIWPRMNAKYANPSEGI
jgi:hypothetical protein